MLLAIREKITGVIAWVVVIGISIVFVFWGVSSYVGGQDNFAIEVNGSEVSFRDYDRLLYQNRQELIRSFGGKLPGYFDSDKYLRSQTIDQLINRELFSQFMEDNRFRIPEFQIVGMIKDDSRFQLNNEFKKEFYESELRSLGVTKQAYEEDLQQKVEARQLEAGLRNTAAVSKQELADFAKLQHQARNFEFIQFSLLDQQKQITNISDEEINEFYNNAINQTRFITEEQVKVEYVELDLKQISDAIRLDEAEINKLYEEGVAQKRYTTDEVRQGSHILIKVPSDASDEEFAKKRAEVETIREQIVAGADFAKIAKDKSEDSGSATKGGSLGEVRRGVMVKPFEDALFLLPENEISEPIKTRFGFHLIRVDAIEPGVVRPFAEARDELVKEYRSQQADPLFYDQLSQLEELAYENSDLSAAAEGVGKKLQTSDWVTASQGEGIAKYPPVRQAAFSDEILKGGRNSEAIEVAPEHVVFLHISEHQPSRKQTIDEAKEQIIAELTSQKSLLALDELVQQVVKDTKPETSFDSIAKKYKAKNTALKDIKRDSTAAPREVVQSIFRLQRPADNQQSFESVKLNNGDVAIVRLTQVKDGDIAWLSDQEKQQLSKKLVGQRGQYDLTALITNLKEGSAIVISENLKAEPENQ